MNYIDLINQFWRMRRIARFSHSEADLYFYLLNEANQLRWENPFPHPTTLLCASIGMSKKTLTEARNKLKQKGLIDFKEGVRNAESPVYTLLLVSENETNYTKKGNQKGNHAGNQKGNHAGNQKGNPQRNKLNKTETKLSIEQKNEPELFSEEREGNGDALPQSDSFSPPKPEVHAKPNLARSVSLDDLMNDFNIQQWNLPRDYVEAWWLKYESEGWVTGGEYPKPIEKPGLKIVEHWRVKNRLMPGGGRYGEESASVPQWSGKKGGYNPNEELFIEFGGERLVYKRGDCNYDGQITNQNHPHFNEIQMAQLMNGVGTGAVH